MTCIIAHRLGWMVADRRVTFGENLIGPYQRWKIRRGIPDLLVGVSGRAVVGDLMEEALRQTVDTTAALAKVTELMRSRGEGSSALVLTADALRELDQQGSLLTLSADHWAIGSGYQAALGWLAGACQGRLVTPDDAKHAITFAGSLNSDIGDGFQVERL